MADLDIGKLFDGKGRESAPLPDKKGFEAIVFEFAIPVKVKAGEVVRIVFDSLTGNFAGIEVRGKFYEANTGVEVVEKEDDKEDSVESK